MKVSETRSRMPESVRKAIRDFIYERVRLAIALWVQGAPRPLTDREALDAITSLPTPEPDEQSIAGFRDMQAFLKPRQLAKGRGGDRKFGKPSMQTKVIRILIRTYDEVLRRDPHSRRSIGWGGPLKRFVRAGLGVIDPKLESRITDKMIQNTFERMKKQHILKSIN